MGDTLDTLVAYGKHRQEESKQKRALNRETSTEILTARGVAFEIKNSGAHLVLFCEKGVFDFWPGTGKWHDRENKFYGRGIRSLLFRIGK